MQLAPKTDGFYGCHDRAQPWPTEEREKKTKQGYRYISTRC